MADCPTRVDDSARILSSEAELAGAALLLLPSRVPLSSAERRVAERGAPVPKSDIARLRELIRCGADPLGDAFSRIREPVTRRANGATFTPPAIVDSMLAWAATHENPAYVVDPGAGSGRFALSAARAFPRARILAVESDPLLALLLRANIAARGLTQRMSVAVTDYRDLVLPEKRGRTLFIGNPPYVRHHDIAREWKRWYSATAEKHGVKASTLAGLHFHFFVKTLDLAKPGDYGAFITAAEWLDTGYGAALRALLDGPLGGLGLHVIAPEVLPFDDAQTTGAITCFEVGRREASLRVQLVSDTTALDSLLAGRRVPWAEARTTPRWSVLVRPGEAVPAGYIELGEICRVHRGQVTGGNDIWIATSETNLPRHVLKPSVTKARELIEADTFLSNASRLRRVIDLPADLDELAPEAREQVAAFLRWARSLGAHESYTALNRKPWYSVRLREPAPIICTYMARRPPAFVRNLCGARYINIAHGLYPREPLSDAILDALADYLRRHVSKSSGRTYAGGLTKFEPGELERVHVPRPENLPL
jgi:hypothetical protein